MASYRTHATGIKVRFLIGDAASFAHTLQHKRITEASTACWYRDQHHLKPLVLDGPDYTSGIAPSAFDVIDTSNLCDHFGSLILLTATSPLLRNQLSSVLYTDVLVKHHKSHKEILDNMLCGHVPTLSTLLGLFPVEYWTSTSSLSSGDEGMLEVMMEGTAKSGAIDSQCGQMFLRTCWKRPVCMEGPSGPFAGLMTIQFDAGDLAHALFQVYLHMFLNEDNVLKFANISLEGLLKSSKVWYHRASFGSFLRLVKTRATCNWDAAMDALIVLIENRCNAPMGMMCIQELFTYLHILDIFSFKILKEWHNRNQIDVGFSSMFTPVVSRVTPVDEKWGDLRDWKNIPPVVCVTPKVPRKQLSVFTNMDRSKLGTPHVHCLLQGARSSGMNTWQNLFPACQMTFGDVSTSGNPHNDNLEISVAEDNLGWKGTSALIAAIYVPAFFLLLEPQKATVAFGIHSSPVTTMTFVSKLGTTMNVYETTLENSTNVYITRYSPNQTGFPASPGFAQTELTIPETANPGANTSLTAGVDQETGRIITLTGRLDVTADAYKSTLENGCQAHKSMLSPCHAAINLGQKLPLTMHFPVFVAETTQRMRIARKSSYVEVIAYVATSSEWMNYPYFMHPVHLQHGKPTNWNMPYLELGQCPVIDTKQHNRLDWLTPHVSLAMSARERALRENKALPRSGGEQIRLDFKDSLFSMLMHSTGLQGGKHQVFGLNDGANGGVHILILTSSLRIDLTNRAVVLDCAVLPLHNEVMSSLNKFLAALTSRGFCRIKVNDAELQLWRRALTACVERCRTWDHRPGCEYAKVGAAPLAVENGKQFLCTCGNGEFPAGFVNGEAHWNAVSKYAVRAAISPAFWAPFADDMYRPDMSGGDPTSVKSRPRGDECGTCGESKGKEGAELLSCARCMEAKYCSRECQRADWKVHKAVCK